MAMKPNGKSPITFDDEEKVKFFRDVSPGPHEAQLRFRLIHFWEAWNPLKKTLIGIEMLLIDEQVLDFTDHRFFDLLCFSSSFRSHLYLVDYKISLIFRRLVTFVSFQILYISRKFKTTLWLFVYFTQGTVIQGFISPGRIERYLPKMKPGSVYKLNNFYGSSNKSVYRVSDHAVTASFSWNSELSVLEDSPIHFDEDRFRFHSFEDFQASCDRKGDLYGNLTYPPH